MQRRVAVTGIGMIAPLGHDPESIWKALKEGKSGIDRISLFDASEFPTKIAGEVKDFSLNEAGEEEKDWVYCGRNIQFAITAAKQAVADSGFHDNGHEPERTGIYLGAGEGRQDFFNFVELIAHAYDREEREVDTAQFITEAMQRLHAVRELEQEPGMSASHLAEMFDAEGPNLNCLTACAASSQAIGEATEIIRRGDADVMISGGTHSMIHPFGVSGFNLLTALSTNNGAPAQASRPFDLNRDGFVIGEGAGMLVLEELERARKRGAKIYGEITGYGSTADAFRITDTHPTGRGAIACLKEALKDAKLNPEQISYINAHGTSTEVNDRVETIAVKEVFGDAAYKIPVSSTKSMTGHLIAAAGSVELIFMLMAMSENIVPPTINYDTPDPECDLDYVPNEARECPLTHCISNSFGFGGQNISLVASRLAD
ncbi:3-oxoacyl-[acyl-carrier-protein] synthase 2 [Planctomycetes bacterium Pan216]|uniref:3-oxoacyl-[acyl-carrier-protein] synthase 2 n=1 Tax=Kolteria novifilia TaxID=2527975 RepID=A0A518BAE8_9BACT|nr:3-oxoacyl-[acyl-carrier-protein] synthase 2 [Planctomycetes bacterium Pan216]